MPELKKQAQAGSCNFPIDVLIWMFKDFNFVPKFSPKKRFSSPNFLFLDDNFRTKTRFSDNFQTTQYLRGWGKATNCLTAAMTPLKLPAASAAC